MWLLENSGDIFAGRKLWLRPGKKYLFGRTTSEPGQIAISHKTISRKHLTITVDKPKHGDSQNPSARSKITVEDLGTKTGTTLDGSKFKGEARVVQQTTAELTLGSCHEIFRISWHPVVFTFSFSSKELQQNPVSKLQSRFEQLDIKILIDYQIQHTTHVVSKKRNTSKGLQALINGKYIVTSSFLDAVEAATAQPNNTTECLLETDFYANWPRELDHLPPRGAEALDKPAEFYGPDSVRQEIFDGYTFIFYDPIQFNNLLAPITNGRGKALLRDVVPDKTSIDDFVRFVKNTAGEKGLGSLGDRGGGAGVVVVRFIPGKGDSVEWYKNFISSVSLRLDHRPIEQGEFLEAIINKDPGSLRRPLEVEEGEDEQVAEVGKPTETAPTRADSPEKQDATPPSNILQPSCKGRARRPAKRRFAGFDDDDDDDDEDGDVEMQDSIPKQESSTSVGDSEPAESQGLFVSQLPDSAPTAAPTTRTSRKRPASPLPDTNAMLDKLAPTTAARKRQRTETGEPLTGPPETSLTPEPEPEQDAQEGPAVPSAAKASPQVKVKKEFDILEMARKHREDAEQRAKAEKEDLAQNPDGIDLGEIRRMAIVEELPLRQGGPRNTRGRESAGAAGGNESSDRWDPRWNGRKTFKKFRVRGEPIGRVPIRTIIPLTEAKNKEFGVGDSYWLEDGDSERWSRPSGDVSTTPAVLGSTSERALLMSLPLGDRVELSDSDQELENGPHPGASRHSDLQRENDEDSGGEAMQLEVSSSKDSRSRAAGSSSSTRGTTAQSIPRPPSTRQSRASQRSTSAGSTNTNKRLASTHDLDDEDAGSTPADSRSAPQKRTRGLGMASSVASDAAASTGPAGRTRRAARGGTPASAVVVVPNSDDDSEDDLRFRFGRRR